MSVRFRSDRQQWVVDVDFEYPDGTRERIRKASPVNTRKGAEEYERQLRTSLLDPARRKPEPEVPTFPDFVSQTWWPTYPKAAQNKPSTIREKKFHLEVHLLPAFKDLKLTDITRQRIDRFVAELSDKKLSPKRIKNILATLRKCLVSAEEWGVIEEVPAFPSIKCQEPPFDFFVREESDRLLEAAEPEARALLVFALRTGARAGEQLALEWKDVDLHNSFVTFRRSSTDGIVTETTKSKKARKVPVGPALKEMLLELRDRKKSELVFHNPDGSPFSLWQLHERLWKSCRRAGLREIRWHDLRHSFGSQLAIAGTPLPQIQAWMGHSSVVMTMKYSHLVPGGGREHLSALG